MPLAHDSVVSGPHWSATCRSPNGRGRCSQTESRCPCSHEPDTILGPVRPRDTPRPRCEDSMRLGVRWSRPGRRWIGPGAKFRKPSQCARCGLARNRSHRRRQQSILLPVYWEPPEAWGVGAAAYETLGVAHRTNHPASSCPPSRTRSCLCPHRGPRAACGEGRDERAIPCDRS